MSQMTSLGFNVLKKFNAVHNSQNLSGTYWNLDRYRNMGGYGGGNCTKLNSKMENSSRNETEFKTLLLDIHFHLVLTPRLSILQFSVLQFCCCILRQIFY